MRCTPIDSVAEPWRLMWVGPAPESMAKRRRGTRGWVPETAEWRNHWVAIARQPSRS